MDYLIVGGHKFTSLAYSADNGELNIDIAIDETTVEELASIFAGNTGIRFFNESDEEIAAYFGFSIVSYINRFYDFGFDVPAVGVCVKQGNVLERLAELEKNVDAIEVEIGGGIELNFETEAEFTEIYYPTAEPFGMKTNPYFTLNFGAKDKVDGAYRFKVPKEKCVAAAYFTSEDGSKVLTSDGADLKFEYDEFSEAYIFPSVSVRTREVK